jgi:hypothetical protein
MKSHAVYLVFILTCLSCSDNNQSAADRKTSEESPVDTWDRHQYFDDVEKVSSDSLKNVVDIADRIVAYQWNGTQGNAANVLHHVVDAYGTFDQSAEVHRELSPEEKEEWSSLVCDTANYDIQYGFPMCFIPHVAFVYYRGDEIIGQSNVCFLCTAVKSVPDYSASLGIEGTKRIKDFCEKLGLTIYDDYDDVSLP